MLSGRFSSVPGLGIQTRRRGDGFVSELRCFTRFILWTGVRDLTPSTPAVCFPWLSWVTFRTARHFADQDFIISLWSR